MAIANKFHVQHAVMRPLIGDPTLVLALQLQPSLPTCTYFTR